MRHAEKIQSLHNAIGIFDTVCTDGNYGSNHAYVARIYTLLSLYLWVDGRKDDAFTALDSALLHFNLFDASLAKENGYYTAPPVKSVRYEVCENDSDVDMSIKASYVSLAEDWPWWCVPPGSDVVKAEIKADPRWHEWVSKLQA